MTFITGTLVAFIYKVLCEYQCEFERILKCACLYMCMHVCLCVCARAYLSVYIYRAIKHDRRILFIIFTFSDKNKRKIFDSEL